MTTYIGLPLSVSARTSLASFWRTKCQTISVHLCQGFPLPDYPRHASGSELAFLRLWWLARTGDGRGRVAARAEGAERGCVTGTRRNRGSLPAGAVRDALARGAHLPGLRPPRLLCA